MIVLDASAAIEFLLATAVGQRIAERISVREETLHAPHLIDLEVIQVLRRYVQQKQLEENRAGDAIEDFLALDLERYPHDLLLPRVWELRYNVTAYDAAYLALAESLGALLLTCDASFRNVPNTSAQVEVL